MDYQDWISQYTSIIKTGGPEIHFNCPSCGEDDQKLYLNTASNRFHCKKCDFGRGIKSIYVLLSVVSGKPIKEVKKEFEDYVEPTDYENLSEKLLNLRPSPEPFSPLSNINENIEDKFYPILNTSIINNYAKSRGLTYFDILNYNLKAAPILRKYVGPFLVFPVIYKGLTVNYQGRRILGIQEPRFVSGDNIGSWLWPLNEMLTGNSVVLVEGPVDAIGCRRHGVQALCTFGKKISDNQVFLLLSMGIKQVTLAWDADATKEVINAVKRLNSYFKVSIADMSIIPHGITKKIDPGNALTSELAANWLKERLSNVIDTSTGQYTTWQFTKL